jgi:hypothetical protein
VLMHALAASCEELRARTGNPPLDGFKTFAKSFSNDVTLFRAVPLGFPQLCIPSACQLVKKYGKVPRRTCGKSRFKAVV